MGGASIYHEIPKLPLHSGHYGLVSLYSEHLMLPMTYFVDSRGEIVYRAELQYRGVETMRILHKQVQPFNNLFQLPSTILAVPRFSSHPQFFTVYKFIWPYRASALLTQLFIQFDFTMGRTHLLLIR